MKSDKLKYAILAVLILIAAVIWVRNLGLFSEKSQFYETRVTTNEKPSSIDYADNIIEYKKPKTNPFLKIKSENNKEIPEPHQLKRPVATAPSSLSGLYRIDGIVIEKGNPQAILKQPNGLNILISVGDSIGDWVIDKIVEDMIIFSQDKYLDTLKISGN